MKIEFGEEALDCSWQEPFPKETECLHCKISQLKRMEDAPATNMARFAFVAHELMGRANFADAEFLAKVRATKKLVCELYESTGKPGGLWLHDCCAVAIYFCPFCLNATALYNQA